MNVRRQFIATLSGLVLIAPVIAQALTTSAFGVTISAPATVTISLQPPATVTISAGGPAVKVAAATKSDGSQIVVALSASVPGVACFADTSGNIFLVASSSATPGTTSGLSISIN